MPCCEIHSTNALACHSSVVAREILFIGSAPQPMRINLREQSYFRERVPRCFVWFCWLSSFSSSYLPQSTLLVCIIRGVISCKLQKAVNSFPAFIVLFYTHFVFLFLVSCTISLWFTGAPPYWQLVDSTYAHFYHCWLHNCDSLE